MISRCFLESCNDWEYRKLLSFNSKCESVQIEDLSMTMCYWTYKVEPIPRCGHVIDNLFVNFGQKVKKSVLEIHELLYTYLLIEHDYFTKVLENYLKSKGQTSNLWLHEMSAEDSHCDKLELLAPAQMCNYHIMVNAKVMNWTVLNIPSEGITHTKHLVYMGHILLTELVKWTIPLKVPDQMVDYKVKFNIKECDVKLSNLMSLTLYDDRDSVADNSPDGDKSDYQTSSDTIIYEPPLEDENVQPLQPDIEVNEINHRSQLDWNY